MKNEKENTHTRTHERSHARTHTHVCLNNRSYPLTDFLQWVIFLAYDTTTWPDIRVYPCQIISNYLKQYGPYKILAFWPSLYLYQILLKYL